MYELMQWRPQTHNSGGTADAIPPLSCLDRRAPEGIRTPNLLIRSQMLYPLSYGRNVYL